MTRVPAPLKPIADQVIRSASSVPANLAEGHGRSGRDRQHHWRIAYASAKEVDSHLRLLAAASAVHDLGAEQAQARKAGRWGVVGFSRRRRQPLFTALPFREVSRR